MKLSKFLCGSLLFAILNSGVPVQNEIVPIIDLRIGGLLGGVRAMDLDVYGFGGKQKNPSTQPGEPLSKTVVRIFIASRWMPKNNNWRSASA